MAEFIPGDLPILRKLAAQAERAMSEPELILLVIAPLWLIVVMGAVALGYAIYVHRTRMREATKSRGLGSPTELTPSELDDLNEVIDRLPDEIPPKALKAALRSLLFARNRTPEENRQRLLWLEREAREAMRNKMREQESAKRREEMDELSPKTQGY
jgi:hypothetical protein